MSGDGRAVVFAGVSFNYSLGLNTVILPLLAVRAGYSDAAVGVLVACSAAAQISMRITLARVFHLLTERTMLITAVSFMVSSSVVALVDRSLPAFVIAQMFQGLGRGFFWTGLQAYVVRTVADSLVPFARVDFVAGIGQAAGAATIGIAGGSLEVSLVCAIAATAATLAPVLRLRALPLFEPKREDRHVQSWRRPGVRLAMCVGASTGLWRGLASAYVPVALTGAGHSSSAAGLMVGLATGASVFGAVAAGLTGSRWPRGALLGAALGTSSGLIGVGLGADLLAVVAAALVVSGLGAGMLQTFGSTIAARAVEPRLRAGAVTRVGTSRAAALLGTPLVVAGLLTVVPLGMAIAMVGAFAASPIGFRWPLRAAPAGSAAESFDLPGVPPG